MSKVKITREQMWQEIKEGKRKKQLWFVYANVSLVSGIMAVLGVLHLGIYFGIYGIYAGRRSLRDKNENAIKAYRVRAWVGVVLSTVGILSGLLGWVYSE